MFWELSTDKVGSDSLVGTAARTLGTLEQTPNHIQFEFPRYLFDRLSYTIYIATRTASGIM